MEALGKLFQDPGSVTAEEVAMCLKAIGQEPDEAKVNAMVDYCHSEPLAVCPDGPVASAVTSPTPGFSGIYRHRDAPLPSSDVATGPLDGLKRLPDDFDTPFVSKFKGCTTMADMWTRAAEIHKGKRCFAVPRADAEGHEFVYSTYDDLWTSSQRIALGIRAFLPSLSASDANVGVHLKTCPEWTAIQLGFCGHGLVPTTMYDSLGTKGCLHIINLTEMQALVTSTSALPMLAKDVLPDAKHIKLVVCVGGSDDDVAAAAVGISASVSVVSYAAVLRAGAAAPQTPPAAKPSDTYLLCFTSGTTGLPKGVPLSHGAMVPSTCAGISSMLEVLQPNGGRHLAFLPMAHVMEQWVQIVNVIHGSEIGFLKGPVTGLADDIKAFAPTVFITAPRVLNRFYLKLQAAVQKVRADDPKRGAVFDLAWRTKEHVLKTTGRYRSPWDFIAFANIRAVFGGKIRAIITGSAPIAPEVQDFFRITLGAPVFDGYGMTEIDVMCTTPPGRWDRYRTCVGVPWPVIEYKTRDIPEMKYFAHDKEGPRGELLVRGPTVLPGYYRSPELTRDAVSADGWFSTGDVVRIGSDGELYIVDRAKALFKLSQGEYVAPEKVEAVVQRVPPLTAAFVYGKSVQDFPVAVVVVDPDVPADQRPSAEELVPKVEAACRAAGLLGFEIPKAIVVSPASFEALGLVTPTLKLVRHDIRERFQTEMAEAYDAAVAKAAPRA
eukprot:TRINITY_DN7043_c0_g2_i1.p1 TRINITY_DN7043_c0_g2~~TRINITY_DN7043_c0_g2_i1.p1  ORF type:complete len:718 (+),score=171.85 TRINITY_DN7043_c0_g2_i1:79-2232(+)